MKDEDSKGFKTQKWFSVCVVSIKQETKNTKEQKKEGKKEWTHHQADVVYASTHLKKYLIYHLKQIEW